MHTLLMPLVGPMQSWGYRSRFDDRDTGLEPTRSGVIGLICSAMGTPRGADISCFDLLRMGVRVDAPGRVMVDYHTALDVIKADGSGHDTVTSLRHYLADARFMVGLESADIGLLEGIDAALRCPVWPLFLGRKSFSPSLPPCLPGSSVMRDTALEEALRSFPYYKLWERAANAEPLRLVIEPNGNCEEALVRGDWPLNFESRSFGLRSVRTDWVDPGELEDGGLWPCISPS